MRYIGTPLGWRILYLGLSIGALTGCINNIGPGAGSQIQMASGNLQSDTIGARLPTNLTVTIPGANAHIRVAVHFASSLVGSDKSDASLYVRPTGPDSIQGFSQSTVDTTDSHGQASVQLMLGNFSGTGHVVVTVSDSGPADTATFTIAPGAAVGIRALPKDTAVYAGPTVLLHGALVDRIGNLRADAVAYTVLTGPVSLSGDTVTNVSIGRALIAVTANGYTDTTGISIVPVGRLAAVKDTGGLVLFDLDGSNRKGISFEPIGHPRWAPSGLGVVADHGSDAGTLVITLDTLGHFGLGDSTSNTLGSQQGPVYSRDGTKVFFAFTCQDFGDCPSSGSALWQTSVTAGALGGNAAAQIPSYVSAVDVLPSPSPDGTQLAYTSLGTASYGVADLRILTLVSGTITDLQVNGYAAAWSPASDLIAYIVPGPGFNAGTLSLIHADGSGAHVIGTLGAYYDYFIDWSPDGQWLVVRNYTTQHLEVINASTNVVLPLAFTTSVGMAAWRPTS